MKATALKKFTAVLLASCLISSLLPAAQAASTGPWGVYAFSRTNTVGGGNGTSGPYADNYQELSGASSVSSAQGSASVTVDIEPLADGINTAVIRGEANASAGGFAYFVGEGTDGYTYTGIAPTVITVTAILTATITNPNNDIFQGIEGYMGVLYPEFTDNQSENTVHYSPEFADFIPPSVDLFEFTMTASGSISQTFTINLNPGDSFHFYTYMYAEARNGGSIESLNSLRYDFSSTEGLVSLSASQVPVPAAFWLFASALGTLVVRRRQR
jgi:hypothetical protein